MDKDKVAAHLLQKANEKLKIACAANDVLQSRIIELEEALATLVNIATDPNIKKYNPQPWRPGSSNVIKQKRRQ